MAPSPSQVADYVNEMRAGSAEVKGMTPREYLTASIVYSNQKCKEFFIAVTEYKRESQVIEKMLNLATAAGTSLYPIYNASTASQAVFTALTTSGVGLNDAVREIYAFGPYASELANKVSESQNVYLGAQSTKVSIKIISSYSNIDLKDQLARSGSGNVFAPIPEVDLLIKVDSVTRDEAMLLARYVAQGYAYQCSVANIQSLIRASIATAKIENVETGQKGALSQAVPAAVP